MRICRREPTSNPCRVLFVSAVLLGAWCGDARAELVGHWSFDEADGTATIFDSSLYVNDGTLTGTTTRVAGKFGNALSLNGINQYGVIPDSPSLSVTGALTIAGWVYTDDTFSADAVISKHYNWEFDLTFRSTSLSYYNGPLWNAGNNTSFSAVVGTGAWHHFTLTRDNNRTVRFYLDGVVQGLAWQAADVPLDSTYTLNIGARPDGSNDYRGLIDEVWMFDHVLNDEQIVGLMELNIVVPEPSTLLLAALACPCLGFLVWRRRRRG